MVGIKADADGWTIRLSDVDGKIIGSLKFEETAALKASGGWAILYGPESPAGATGHVGLMERDGVQLHALCKIRVSQEAIQAHKAQAVWKSGLSMYEATANGAFDSTPAFHFKPIKSMALVSPDWVMHSKAGELVAIARGGGPQEYIREYLPWMDRPLTTIAPGVDAVLVAAFISVLSTYWGCSPYNA